MTTALLIIFAVALLGSIFIPLAIIMLASFGYFEPIQFELFGRLWAFGQDRQLPVTASRTSLVRYTDLVPAFSLSVIIVVSNIPNSNTVIQTLMTRTIPAIVKNVN